MMYINSMIRGKNIINAKNLTIEYNDSIIKFADNWTNDYKKMNEFAIAEYGIDSSVDPNIISSFSKDWSNMPGHAEILFRPKNTIQCSIIMKICFECNINLTISAGRTNLTGSATANGGAILSTVLLTSPDIKVDIKLKEVLAPVGIPLESLRLEVLNQSNRKLYYPVDPTSRHDAFVGGTLLCNASGFIPGEKGATRYWVREIDVLLPNGNYIKIKRGDYFSINGKFKICDVDNIIEINVPNYQRPKIKNASGPYSCFEEEIDFIDFFIGSEGIYGMITSCRLGLDNMPDDFLELFLCLPNESKAIAFYDYIHTMFSGKMDKLTALEYFGYNSQSYMKHKEFLFKNDSDVGIYLQIPIYNDTIENISLKWIDIINDFDKDIDINSIIVLNDPHNWKKFFEARHSIPDNALTKTKKLGGVSIITDTIVPPENFSVYLDKVHKKLQKNNIEYLLFGHLGDCHLHFHLIPDKNQDAICMEIYDYMIDLSAELGGVYSAEHGTGKRKKNDFKKCYGQSAVDMVKEAKKAIDPNLLLNGGNVI